MCAAGHGDRPCFLSQCQRLVAAALRSSDVDESNQICCNPRHQVNLAAQAHRLLQPVARRVESTGSVLRDTQMPQRLGQRPLVVDPRGKVAGPFKRGNGHRVVVADNLVKATFPEERLCLPTLIIERLIQLRRVLEQGQLARILDASIEISGMQNLAPSHGKVGLKGVQVSFSGAEAAGIAIKDGALVKRSSPINPIFRSQRDLQTMVLMMTTKAPGSTAPRQLARQRDWAQPSLDRAVSLPAEDPATG